MKYISKITLGLALGAALLLSCKDDNGLDANQGITLDKETISIGPDGGVESILVTSAQNWVSSASQPWVAVSPANGFGSVEGTLAIDSTLEATQRTAQVRYRQEDNSEVILTITQFGYGKQIVPSESEISIKSSDVYDNRYFDLTISTNVAFKVDENIEYAWGSEISPEDEAALTDADLKNWITAPKNTDVDLDRKDRPRTVTIRFGWSMNTAPYTRVAKIRLVPSNPDDELVDENGNPTGEVIVTVTQEAAVRITDDRSGDSIAVVMMDEKIQTLFAGEYSDKMENWTNVTLWEEGDDDLPADDAVGRIRSLSFMLFDLQTGETLPKEIKYLKYLEEFSITSNSNRQIKKVELGEEICQLEYLKRLSVVSYGLASLPEGFAALGDKLEYLDLASNNFPNLTAVTDVVNSANFPHLKGLELSTSRLNDTTVELAGATGLTEGELGLYVNLNDTKDRENFMELLKWDNLEYLGMSYLLIEGELPSDSEMLAALPQGKKNYTDSDFYFSPEPYAYEKISGDTCRWLLEGNPITLNGEEVSPADIARVLPKAHTFTLNLNFITGSLPNWILFHPYFMEWNPESMIMNQWEKGKDSAGQTVGFSNAEDIKGTKYKFYYGDGTTESGYPDGVAYPGYYNKYVGGGVDWKP